MRFPARRRSVLRSGEFELLDLRDPVWLANRALVSARRSARLVAEQKIS